MMRRASLLLLILASACDNDARAPGGDVTDVPVCDPAECTTPPAAVCDVDQLTLLTSAAGTCGVAGCEYAPVSQACDTDLGYCRDGACVAYDDICDYAWGDRLSIISEFAFGGQSDELDPASGEPLDACCFDLDGKPGLDNRMGAGFKALSPLLGNINDDFADQIERARMNIVLDFFGVDDLAADPHVEMAGYETVRDASPADNPALATGLATFGLRARSFHLPAHLPRILATGAITDGRFVAERASYSFITATVADSVAAIPVREVRFEADVEVGPNGRGLALTDGKIGGLIALSDFFGALNADAVETCACRRFADDPTDEGPIDLAHLTCRTPLEPDCGELESDSLCRALTTPQFCQIFVDAFPPDVDLDGDGALGGADAVTVGVRFAATSAALSGWYDHCPGAWTYP